MKINQTQMKELLKSTQRLQYDYQLFLRKFVKGCGYRAISQAKLLTPVDTGTLRNGWQLSKIYRVDNLYSIDLQNNVEYASFIEYGHMDRGKVKKFIPGYHMGGIAIIRTSDNIPKRLEAETQKFFQAALKVKK